MAIQFAVFIAVSLDGFIARPDGRIDWLDRFQPSGLVQIRYQRA